MKIEIVKNAKTGEKSLALFDSGIQIDSNLPKFKKQNQDGPEDDSKAVEGGFNSRIQFSRDSFDIISSTVGNTVEPASNVFVKEKGFWDKGKALPDKGFWANLLFEFRHHHQHVPDNPNPPPPPPPRPHASSVFYLIVNNKEELELMKGKVEKLKLMTEEAIDNGQIALAENIRSKANIALMEDQLVHNKFNKIVSEAQMIEFVEGYEKELSMTYIRNFVRAIPKNVIANKKLLDSLDIFDNYIILHFDPTDKNSAKTQQEIDAEIARRRDPIMFGLIKGSRKFYCIGDWVDEYCDLTMDAFIEKYTQDKITLEEQIELDQ